MGWVTEIHPRTEELNACVQCGLCLPACPTFRLTGRETASPRGRLHAMMAVSEGIIEVDQSFAGIIDFCLGCRACEPVCPGLVPYGRTLEGTRAEIAAQLKGRKRRTWLLGSILPSRPLMRLGAWALSVAQLLRLTKLAPQRYRRLTGGMRSLLGRGRQTVGYRGGSGSAGTAALLAGCIQDQWFRPVNRAAITLLEMAGHQVEVPTAQTCCGALAAHDGEQEVAFRLAARNSIAFDSYDLVVATAAGCSAHLAGYGHWNDGSTVPSAAKDITVVVAQAIADGRLPRSEVPRGVIAIQDPCHLRHAQRVITEPRQILEAAGYEVLETDEAGLCCGAAGLYTVLQPEASSQLGNQKADQVRATGSTKVASANPGCEMQLRAHLDADYQIAHPIEWYLSAVLEDGGASMVSAHKRNDG